MLLLLQLDTQLLLEVGLGLLVQGRGLLQLTVHLLIQTLGHGPALLGVNSLALALSRSAAVLVEKILERIRCYR